MSNSIVSAFRRYRLRHPVYIFHHIPKCGGTSVRKVLDDWFHVYDDYYEGENRESISPVDLKYLNSEKCLCGHFGHQGFMLDERYPQVFGSFRARHRYRVFSFLRDPLDMRCSLFRHQMAEGFSLNASLADSIMTYDNYYARIMGLNEQNYLSRLQQYFFIGLQSEMQNSIDVLGALINKPKVILPRVNRSQQTSDNGAASLSSKQIKRFNRANKLDYQIYDFVQKRFDDLLTRTT